MTATLSPAAATQLVLWGALVLGMALGGLAQASRFCTMGALADLAAYGGQARLMMWVLAVAAAATGSLVLMAAGWLDAARSLAWSPQLPWLSCLVGGALFGWGMVLASGCPQRNLVRAGSGNLRSWVVLLVTGVAAQMTLRGLFAEGRVHALDAFALQLHTPQDLGSILAGAAGLPQAAAAIRWGLLILGLALAAVLLWRARGQMDGWQWAGGLGMGLLVTLGWALTGHLGFIAENPDTLEPAWMGTAGNRPESLSFVAPLARGLDLLTLWSDHSLAATFGVMVAVGVPVGSAVSAWRRREFRVESFSSPRDLSEHLLGAVLMGFGGVTALGCSIGQGITGLGMLSAGACLAVTGIVGGAWVALQRQARRMEREAG
jgi:uncharacterized membrane protein YedE/YeeE